MTTAVAFAPANRAKPRSRPRPPAPRACPSHRDGVPDISATWDRYRRTGEASAREALLVHYAPLVTTVARRTPAAGAVSVDVGDLISAGMFGLIDAVEKFDPSRGVPFEPYAVNRIRGAIVDELRANDWAPRSVRSRARQLDQAFTHLEGTLHRAPTTHEVADHLGVDVRDVANALTLIAQANVAALDAPAGGTSAPDSTRTLAEQLPARWADEPAAVTEAAATRQVLAEAVATLPEQQKLVVALYYFEGLTLAEIGKVLSLTESRISQIHTTAVRRLRATILAAERG